MDDQRIIIRSLRTPIVAPESPGQFRARIIELRFLPVFAVIETDFDAADPTIATERDTGDANAVARHGDVECRFMIRLIETRTRWDDEVRAPPLCLVKACGIPVSDLD